jgi:hypothetical protein
MSERTQKRRQRRGFAVLAAAFTLCLTVVLFYAQYTSPSAEKQCVKKCAEAQRHGRLIPQYRPEVTAGMRSRGPMICECY